MANLGLNSTALLTIAQTMRDQNAPPNEEMPYSSYAGAVSTYAVINAMELIASGLQAEELRLAQEERAYFQQQVAALRMAHEAQYRHNILEEGYVEDQDIIDRLDNHNP